MIVTVRPRTTGCSSNGTRLETRNDRDGSTIWHYRMKHPHASYLVMLGIGDYRVEHRTEQKRGSGGPLVLPRVLPTGWSPPTGTTTEMVDFMEKETGVPYPWESYAQIPVQDFLYGAMENTTATVFGDFYPRRPARLSRQRNYRLRQCARAGAPVVRRLRHGPKRSQLLAA